MIVRQIVAPLAGVYVLFLSMLVVTERRRRHLATGADEPKAWLGSNLGGAAPRWPALVGHVVSTVAGGYVCFLVLVGGYYFAVARQTHSFLRQALTGGALLAFGVVLPGFLLLSLLAERLGAWRVRLFGRRAQS